MVQHGSFTRDKKGDKILQYPIYTDTVGETIGTGLTSLLFGKTSLRTGQAWVEGGFKNLTAVQTAAYLGMMEADVDGKDAYEVVKLVASGKKTDQKTERQVKADLLRNAEISDEGKAVAYYSMIASEREVALLDKLADMDSDVAAANKVLMDMLCANTDDEAREVLRAAEIETDDKKVMYDYFFGKKQKDGTYSAGKDEKIQALEASGFSFEQFLELQNVYNAIDDSYEKAKERATEFSRWVDGQQWSAEQKAAAKDTFKYFSFVPAEAGRYDQLVDAGLSSDVAYAFANELDALKPEEGETAVSKNQRVMAIWNSEQSNADKEIAIAAISKDTVSKLTDAGVSDSIAQKLATAFAVADAKNGDESLTVIEKAKIVANQVSGKKDASNALYAILPEDTWAKVDVAFSHGVTVKNWVEYKEQYAKKYGSQNPSMERVETILDGMKISDQAKAALWQIANKSWKAANNPYSTMVGSMVLKEIQ